MDCRNGHYALGTINYYKLLIKLACSSCSGDYWPLVDVIQISLHSVYATCGSIKTLTLHLSFSLVVCYIWVIDQVWGQDGWILAKFFFCVFMDRDEVEVLAKKERGQYPAILTEQTWSIKDLLCGFRDNFACGRQRVVPSGQDGSILPARVANHSARFASSCPLAELAIK